MTLRIFFPVGVNRLLLLSLLLARRLFFVIVFVLAFLLVCAHLLHRLLIELLMGPAGHKLLIGFQVVVFLIFNAIVIGLLVERVSISIVHFQLVFGLFLIFLGFLLVSVHLLVKFVLRNHLLQVLVDQLARQEPADERLHPDNRTHRPLVNFNHD